MTADRPEIISREPLSYAAFLARAGETRHVEWSGGQALVYPLPDTAHQQLATFLTSLLSSFVAYFELGQAIAAPFETRLWPDGPAREPDVLFVSRDQQARLDEGRFSSGPALMVEIISPAGAAEDRGRKFQDYEQAGAQEYMMSAQWILHQLTRLHRVQPELVDRALEQMLATNKDLARALVIDAYQQEMISLGKAAELLNLAPLALRERFIALGIPLRSGPATLDEARAEVEGLAQWFEESSDSHDEKP